MFQRSANDADQLQMSPFDAPGAYSLLQYTELAEGIWYPRGGFHKVSLHLTMDFSHAHPALDCRNPRQNW